GGMLRCDFLELLRQRKALLCRGIAELVISRQDQASDSVARGADTGDVAPAIHRVGYVNAVRAAMTTAPWVEIYCVGGERDGLAHMLRQHPFTKSGGDGVCRLGAVAVTERVRQPLDPGILGLALARRSAQQSVLVEKFGQELADFRFGVILAKLRLLVDTVAHGLTEES